MTSQSDCFILLRDGRKLGYAEYGDPLGEPVFLCHGMPGSRLMQHPDPSIAIENNVRLIVPDRPGMGLSDFKPGRQLLDWPADVEELANHLGITGFVVAGISGGGPYAAACGFVMPDRVGCVGLISSVGLINTPGAMMGMLPSNRMGYSVGRWMPWFLWSMAFSLYYGDFRHHPEKLAKMQEGEPAADHIIFEKSGVRQVFINNFAEAFRQGTVGLARDGWLLSRPWGFPLQGISVPVYLWQGEADVIVTPAMGKHMASQIPKCSARFYPGEGHLVFITHWQEILVTLTNKV
jgi:pimeloyl-ACP methyl ester carboxylesterase